MAIIIPSKNIYEINNQKVVDNEVDNIEVSAKRIEETKDFSVNVYNNDFDVVTYQHGAETSDIHEEYRPHTHAPTSYCAVSGVFKPFYVDIDVVVNKQIGNKIITQIKTGEDKTDETANIKYTTACIKKSAPISARYHTSESGRHDPSFTNIQYTYLDDGEEGVFNLPKTITVQHNYSDISLSEITVNLNDETNLKDIGGTIKITETNDYFSFTCHLLCGEEIYELKGDAVGPPTNRSTASGTATIYIPQKISLTVYGNTIGIDLQDETVKIGDGQHVYSFSGNELMQTSNTLSIENKYNVVLREWENGKEIATIKCAVDKYGDSIDPSTSNMTFHIGDTVIPYIMGADGNDKPMSLYVDKTPKEFVVIGKGIIADGQIMQELTLQEQTFVIIKILSIDEYFYDMKFEVLYGEISPYDIIEFNGEEFFVQGTAQSARGLSIYAIVAEDSQFVAEESIKVKVVGRDEKSYPTATIRVIMVRGGGDVLRLEISSNIDFSIGTHLEYQAEQATVMESTLSPEGEGRYIIFARNAGVFYGAIGQTITVKIISFT